MEVPDLMTEEQMDGLPESVRREITVPVPRSVLPGSNYDVSGLRRMIQAPVLLQVLHTAAMAGVVPQVDPMTGVEIGPARPIKAESQLDVAMKLLNKAVPDVREAAAPYADPNQHGKLIDVTPEKVRTLTKEQLEKAIMENVDRKNAAQTSKLSPAGIPTPVHSTLSYFQEDDGGWDE